MDSLRRKPHSPQVPVTLHDVTPSQYSSSQELPPADNDIPAPPPVMTSLYPSNDPLASNQNQRTLQGQRKSKLFLALFFFLLIICGAGSFLLLKGLLTAEKIQVRGNTVAAPTLAQKLKTLQAAFLPGEMVPLKGEERGRINVLLLGKAGSGLPGENLTDTIMLASIDIKTKKVALLSLPRDLYVEDTARGSGGKINTFYQRSLARDEKPLEMIKDAITTITGEPVDYFFVMDFDGFEQTVDALGGITVEVPKDFYDPRYPGKIIVTKFSNSKKDGNDLMEILLLSMFASDMTIPKEILVVLSANSKSCRQSKIKPRHPAPILIFSK